MQEEQALITANEALAGLRVVIGNLVVDKTLLEVENNKLKAMLMDRDIKVSGLTMELASSQLSYNELRREVESNRKTRYPASRKSKSKES